MTASDNDEICDKPVKINRPSVPVINSITYMSNIERKLTKLFKCCFYRDRCFFTTDDAVCFLNHLDTCHGNKDVSCIYCYYQSGETEPYKKADRLIDHIITNHGLRNFQCNLCVYRGSSIPHVLLHQANIHGNNYQTTLSGDGSVGICKVLVCKQIVSGPLPSETVYWSNCRVERKVDPPKESPKYQCLYCEFVSFIPHVVFFHICKVHPDYSLTLYDKYVDQLPEIKEAEEKVDEVVDDEDAELDAIVHDLHSIGTKDDDEDMTPVDDAPPEEFSGDDETVAKNQPNASISTRERLFALKGVRIAKKQPDDKPGKARKSTGKQIVEPEPEFDREEEDEEEHLTARQRIMRGYRPEQSAALFKPVALAGSQVTAKSFVARNMFKCLICADGAQISRVGIGSHLMLKHNTDSSLKCSECKFVGSVKEIIIHFKSIHSFSDSSVRYIKFIVAMDETEEASQPMLGQPVRSGDLTPMERIRRKNLEKDPKNLSSKIKRSVFIGPKSWRDKQRQLRKENAGEDADDSEREEMEIDDTIESVVNQGSSESQDRTERSDRIIRQKKRKASELEDEPSAPVSIEELLELKSSRERESEYFFCLFCPSLSTKDFSEAQAHIKCHLELNIFTCSKCSIFQCENIQELKEHHENVHPNEHIPLPNASANNTHINYIIEFLNEQFIRRRKGDQMSPDQAARYARIICPICESANKITGDTNFHFTKWKSFKIHFWKHANASFIKCRKCGALVPRTRKRAHLDLNHPEDLDGPTSDIKDFTPFYHEPLPELALNSLKSCKRIRKALYESRIKEEFEITECRVEIKRMKTPETEKIQKIKEEPLDT